MIGDRFSHPFIHDKTNRRVNPPRVRGRQNNFSPVTQSTEVHRRSLTDFSETQKRAPDVKHVQHNQGTSSVNGSGIETARHPPTPRRRTPSSLPTNTRTLHMTTRRGRNLEQQEVLRNSSSSIYKRHKTGRPCSFRRSLVTHENNKIMRQNVLFAVNSTWLSSQYQKTAIIQANARRLDLETIAPQPTSVPTPPSKSSVFSPTRIAESSYMRKAKPTYTPSRPSLQVPIHEPEKNRIVTQPRITGKNFTTTTTMIPVLPHTRNAFIWMDPFGVVKTLPTQISRGTDVITFSLLQYSSPPNSVACTSDSSFMRAADSCRTAVR